MCVLRENTDFPNLVTDKLLCHRKLYQVHLDMSRNQTHNCSGDRHCQNE